MVKRTVMFIIAFFIISANLIFLTDTASAAHVESIPSFTYAKEKPVNKVSNRSDKLISFATKQLGKGYSFGSAGPNSFDCSGFIYYVFSKNDYDITRESSASHWKNIKKVNNAEPGDVVFFENTYISGPSHMGIYLGDDKFIHANSGRGQVKIDSLTNSYYKTHFLGFGRFK